MPEKENSINQTNERKEYLKKLMRKNILEVSIFH
jgi:hypothetical protein